MRIKETYLTKPFHNTRFFVQSSALRMVLGAFRTSPNISLCAESAEPPLHFRSLTLTANFLASVAQFPDLPIHTSTLSNFIFITSPNSTLFFLSHHPILHGYSLLLPSNSILQIYQNPTKVSIED